jgi:hypothetical protein
MRCDVSYTQTSKASSDLKILLVCIELAEELLHRAV